MATPPMRARGRARSGVLDLAGHLGDVGPAVVGPEGGDEGDHEAAEAAAGRREGWCGSWRSAVAVAWKQKPAMTRMSSDLEPGEGELDVAGFAGAEDVEPGDGPGDGDGEDLRPGDAPRATDDGGNP